MGSSAERPHGEPSTRDVTPRDLTPRDRSPDDMTPRTVEAEAIEPPAPDPPEPEPDPDPDPDPEPGPDKVGPIRRADAAEPIACRDWSDREDRYEMIAEAAYFRAEKRGFALGDEEIDWLEAERELIEQLEGDHVDADR